MLLVLATILVTAWPVTDAAAFHPGHKVLPHLPRTLKNRLRHTPLLNLPSQPDSSLCGAGAGAGAEGLRAASNARSRCDDIVLWNKHTERQILNGKITVLWNGNPGGS